MFVRKRVGDGGDWRGESEELLRGPVKSGLGKDKRRVSLTKKNANKGRASVYLDRGRVIRGKDLEGRLAGQVGRL